MPFTWIVICFLWGVFTKRVVLKRRLLRTGIVFLLFFSNSFIVDEFVRVWEIPAFKLEENEKYKAAVVLGGMISYDESLNRYNFNSNSDRLLQTLLLQNNKHFKKVIFSGGSGDYLHGNYKEAYFVKDYLERIDYSTRHFVFESESRNTHENADSTVAILKKMFPGENLNGKVLLATSALHMKRSLACFKASGIECVGYSTNRLSGPRKFEWEHLLIPNSGALNTWNHLLHEMFGYAVYAVMGYI